MHDKDRGQGVGPTPAGGSGRLNRSDRRHYHLASTWETGSDARRPTKAHSLYLFIYYLRKLARTKKKAAAKSKKKQKIKQ